jgi:hypothetical protein
MRDLIDGIWWMAKVSINRQEATKEKSHQRQLVDASSPFYKHTRGDNKESHQRQLVDGSSPFYKNQAGNKRIPPTAVGG